jgi:hypothetical protein
VDVADDAEKLPPQAARRQAARDQKLAEMAEQVESGELVVRQMTAAEKKRFAAAREKRDATRVKRAPRAR